MQVFIVGSPLETVMELSCTLSIIRIMKDESISLDERLVKAHRVFDSQGHSGTSATLNLYFVSAITAIKKTTIVTTHKANPTPIIEYIFG